ncbi:unnamed protein product [Adineta ricciae]|uniref:VCBS repeat-containing protein n=1 Tax=Adineta ricciae TaxID=249248 RepID=A0A814UJK7_ADIRI|nr:unnamed protein product [Adineta ricciae]
MENINPDTDENTPETDDISISASPKLTKISRSIQFSSLFAIFTSISIIISTLVVYYNAPKPEVALCQMNFKRLTEPIIEYNYGPRGVALADFDGDKLIDMVVVNRLVDNIAIYKGDGTGYFTKQIQYSTDIHSKPYMVAIGDFNKDLHIDIAVANFAGNNVGIFLNLGNGLFANQLKYSIGSSHPIFLVIEDLNNDTYLDIITANYGTHSIGILYGYGDKEFMNPLIYSTGYDSYPSSLVVGDIDNDMHLDIIVANYGTDTIGIFFGMNKKFSDQMIISMGHGSHPLSIAAADFNNDQFLDIAVANSGTNTIIILLNNGNKTFNISTAYKFDNNSSPYCIGTNHVNQDNLFDLIITNKGINNIVVLLGKNDGTFILSRTYSTGSTSSISFAMSDINKDNRIDIVTVNNDTGSLDIMIGKFEGFYMSTSYSIDLNLTDAITCDLNNDNHLDMIMSDYDSDKISIYLRDEYGFIVSKLSYVVGGYSSKLAVADLNNDHFMDVVVLSLLWPESYVSTLLGLGNGSLSFVSIYKVGNDSTNLVVIDINNDNYSDIVVLNSGSQDMSILLGYGNGSVANQLFYKPLPGTQAMAIADLNKDSILDIVVSVNYQSIRILLGLGNCSFLDTAAFEAGVHPFYIGIDDLNNDTILDIIVINLSTNDMTVLLGIGNGSFTNRATYAFGSTPGKAIIADVNNDNILDIVVMSSSSSGISIFFGYGDGRFADQFIQNINSHPIYITLNDYNNDSNLDLIVIGAADMNSRIDVLLQYNRGYLFNKMTYVSADAARLRYIDTHDVNNDTHLDIIAANYGSNNIGLLFGHGNGTFNKQTIIDTGLNSHPSSVTINDYDGDKQLDIAVFNYDSKNLHILNNDGQEIKYTATIKDIVFNSTPSIITANDLKRRSTRISNFFHIGQNMGVNRFWI